MDSGLCGFDRERVHHFDGGGNDPRADDVRHRAARLADAVEGGEQRLHAFRFAKNADDRLGDHRQRAFAADNQPEQIGAGRIGQRAADLHELAVWQHRVDRKNVVNGESVPQAMRAARVLGDVATDRAHLLARGIRRVVVAVRRDLSRDLEIGDAGLHRHSTIRNVHVEHAIEPGQADHHATRNREALHRRVRCRDRAQRTARLPWRTSARPPGPLPLTRAARRAPASGAGAAARRTRRSAA